MIPSGIFQIYYDVCDEFLTNDYIGKSCTVYYPPLRQECSNCTTVSFGGISRNVYAHGGPAPFSDGNCPLCGGNGFKEVETTESIRLRIYWSKRDWTRALKISNINVPQADVMIIGFMTDVMKIKRMNFIQLVSDLNISGNYRLIGEPFNWGFGKNRYFVSFLERS